MLEEQQVRELTRQYNQRYRNQKTQHKINCLQDLTVSLKDVQCLYTYIIQKLQCDSLTKIGNCRCDSNVEGRAPEEEDGVYWPTPSYHKTMLSLVDASVCNGINVWQSCTLLYLSDLQPNTIF